MGPKLRRKETRTTQLSPSMRGLLLLILLLGLCALSCEFVTDRLSSETAIPDVEVAGSEASVPDVAEPEVAGSGGVEPEVTAPEEPPAPLVDNPNPPADLVKLVFIHHSCGENWLADDNGRLGLALRDNNYFVSDTNYGWGPDGIGDRTDIADWPEWFFEPDSGRYLEALYSLNDNVSGVYSRSQNPDPGRENDIILFKSCFPNSNLDGAPTDTPAPGDPWTVSGAKQVYRDLLGYFATQPDKLFVAITAPPVTEGDSIAPPANARALNNWLINDWLVAYPLNNVAVFDFYNVLTSNGGDEYTSDQGRESGNHHRWWEGAVQHIQTVDYDLAAYPTEDSHPSVAGNQKATAEFVPLLNVYFHRWRGAQSQLAGRPPAGPLSPPPPDQSPVQPPPLSPPAALIQPGDFIYLGAFRLPGGDDEFSWAWGGEALAYYPGGDLGGPEDGFIGSLFGTGHNWHQQVSEITIPEPVSSSAKNVEELNVADTLQAFQNIRGDLFDHLDFEVPRAGLAYLPPQGLQETGKLHFCWGQHFQEGPPWPSHGWSDLDLANPAPVGAWVLNGYTNYSTTDYLFPIPEAWAAANTPGYRLATGRFRDGGWSGQGPALFAYGPWTDGDPPPPGAQIAAIPLLLYASTFEDDPVDRSYTMRDYGHADEWAGGAWLTAGDRSAVIFVGTKGLGDHWYGFANGVVWPDDPPYPEIPDPPYDDRGWWSNAFQGQFIFYDPAQLAAVARGELAPYEPQPYAVLAIDDVLYHIQSEQQKHHLGAAAFDSERSLLYVFEPFGDGDKPIVHVWRIS